MKKSVNFNTLLTGIALMVCFSASTSAAPLFSLGDKGVPDIQSNDLTVNYSASSGNFDISGSGFNNYIDAGSNDHSFIGNFSLNFSVDNSGSLDDSGGFSINDLHVPGFDLGLDNNLLTGIVADFGFTNTTFEVLLDITSGALAAEFSTNPGLIVSGDFSSFVANGFGVDFQHSGVVADTFKKNAVPEPSIMLLFAVIGFGFFTIDGRKRINNSAVA